MSIDKIISALPPETKARLYRMASNEGRSAADVAFSILSKGANTHSLPVMASMSSSGDLFLKMGANTCNLTLAGRVAVPVSDVSSDSVTMGTDYEQVKGLH